MALRIGIGIFLIIFFGALYAFMSGNDQARREDLTVFAASSFAYVLKEEKAEIEKALNINLTVVEASSSTLARQIEEGAPADVFISADREWMTYLEKNQKLGGKPDLFAKNRLSLVFRLSAYQEFCQVQFFAPPTAGDLLKACPYSSKVATGDPAFVPLGKYAEKVLKTLNLNLDLVPAPNAISAKALLETGATDAAILYETDTGTLKEEYTSFIFAELSDVQPVYAAAALKQSNNLEKENFLAFLKSEEFKTILKARGFEVDG